VIFKELDGIEVAEVPLGKAAVDRCLMAKTDWERHVARGFSQKLHLHNGHVEITQGPVARILLGVDENQHAEYHNGDPKYLRRANLKVVAGKGGKKVDRAKVDPRKGRRAINVEALGFFGKMQAEDVHVSKLQLPPDGSKWTAENILEEYDPAEDV